MNEIKVSINRKLMDYFPRKSLSKYLITDTIQGYGNAMPDSYT